MFSRTLKSALAVTFVVGCNIVLLPNLLRYSSNEINQSTERRVLQSTERRVLSDAEGPGRFFGCGGIQLYPHSYGVKIMTDIFPNVNHTVTPIHNINDIEKSGATANDLCVYFVDFCDLNPDDFPGKTLVVSGEAEYRFGVYSLPTGSRTFYLTPKADSERSIRIPFVTMLLHTRQGQHPTINQEMMKIRDHVHKPKNNLENFLIYAVSNCNVRYRQDAFDALSKIGVVHYGGSCHGNDENLGSRKLPSPYEMDRYQGANNNFLMFSKYRYALVMENQNAEGYITEKILNAFLGGAVPIWYGTREIFDIFSEKAFIYYDIEKPHEALERISFLEQNRDEYERMLNETILKQGEHTIEKYFSFTDEIGNGSLGRRIRSMLGYESRIYHYGILESNLNKTGI